MTTPPIFPTLVLGWSIVKRVISGSTLQAVAGTGRQTRARLWSYPMWEWDLTWEYLPDYQGNGVTADDFRTALGNFLLAAGAYGGFLYQDQDDNLNYHVVFATGDGSTTTFLLTKVYGLGEGAVEPIGYLNQSQTFNIYVNGALQTLGTAYTVNTTTPYAQTITFATAPLAGAAISCDMSYYFWCRFKDDIGEWSEIYSALWEGKKVTIASMKN